MKYAYNKSIDLSWYKVKMAHATYSSFDSMFPKVKSMYVYLYKNTKKTQFNFTQDNQNAFN